MSRQDDIKKLIRAHYRRMQVLKEQRAIQGVSIDPKIIIEIEDIEAELEKLEADLKELDEGIATPSQINSTISSSIHGKSQRAKEWGSRMKNGKDFLEARELLEAERCFVDALVLTQGFVNQDKKKREMETLAFLGHTYRKKHSYGMDCPDPVEYYKKAIDIAIELRDYEWESSLCLDISEFYSLVKEDGETAFGWAQRSLSVSRVFDYDYGQAMAWMEIGYVYFVLARTVSFADCKSAKQEYEIYKKIDTFYQKVVESYGNALTLAQRIDKQSLTEERRRILRYIVIEGVPKKIASLQEDISLTKGRMDVLKSSRGNNWSDYY